jgi:hypothetical protein
MASPSGVFVEEKDVLWKDKSTKAVFRRTERETTLDLAFVSIRHHSWRISHYVEVADPSRIEAPWHESFDLDESAGHHPWHPNQTTERSKLASLILLLNLPNLVRINSSKSAPSSISSKRID